MTQTQDWILDTEIFDGLKENPYKKEKIVSDWVFPENGFPLSSLFIDPWVGTPKPKLKSLRMLGQLIDNSEQLSVLKYKTCSQEIIQDLVLLVRSNSRRYYTVTTSYNLLGTLFSAGPPSEYSITVQGARWKEDLLKDSKYNVKLCLNPSSRYYGNRNLTVDFPIGDKISTLCLHLINDVELGLRIPLVAQFLITPRTTLSKIDTFQEEFIVWNEMIDYSDEEPSCCEMTEVLEDYDCGCADRLEYERHMESLASELSQEQNPCIM